MATIALPRTARAGFPALREPALLIPLVGAGVLVYLAVLPLAMLVMGSFQAEVAPREFVYTLKNYQNAYASKYTYSTFQNSLIFASGSAALSFILGTLLAWLTERTNTPLRKLSFACCCAADPPRSARVDRLDFPSQPQVRLH